MKRLTGILLVFVFLLAQSYAQNLHFTTFSIEEGLSQSVVNCILQDSKGYIWLGTQNGLDRFDGKNFELFRFDPADTNSITNNWIYAISEDHEGNLWIGTKGGLHKFIRNENCFELIRYSTGYDVDVSEYSYDNIRLSDGKILINTPPIISVYDPVAQLFAHFNTNLPYDASVKDSRVPVLEDQSGKIWVGSSNGLVLFSPETGQFQHCSVMDAETEQTDINVTALYEDRQGRVWLGTDRGLFYAEEGTLQFKEAQFKLINGDEFRFQSCIRSLLYDGKDNLIVATEGAGVFYLTEQGDQQYSLNNFTLDNSGIGHDITQCLLIDKSENLWVGTLSGVSKTDLKPKKFKLFRNSNLPNSVPLSGNVMAALFKNDDGIIWAGNWGQGLNLVNPETGEVEHFASDREGNHYLPNDFVHTILKDNRKNIWLGTRNGIFIFDQPHNRFVDWRDYFNIRDLPSFENIRIYHIIQDRNERYWIASANGLYRVNINTGETDLFHSNETGHKHLNANLIYTLFEDSEGLIWIATINGLAVFNPEKEEIKHFSAEQDGLSSNFLISLCEDSEGNIWIGSNAYINIFDKKTSTFRYMGKESGLLSNYIYEIRKDKNGEMWFATGNGLSRLDSYNGKLENFTLEDGLQSAEFNLRSAHQCEDGEMLFGGMNGFNSFYPDSIAENPYLPDLVFSAFSVMSSDNQESPNISGANKIVLNHKVQSFTIEFSALEYTNSANNHFAYKMEGVYDKWLEIGTRSFVPFFALPSGDYTFWLKGSNNDGKWNNDPIKLNITVLPPWWRSPYAYSLYIILGILAIAFLIHLRERRLKEEKLKLENLVLKRTLQIEGQNKIIRVKNKELQELNRTKDKFFSIIGHDLRNHFNVIIGFSENLLSGTGKMDQTKQEKYVQNIYKSSIHAHDLLGNLLTWARLQRNAIAFLPESFMVAAETRNLLAFHEEAALKKNILLEVLAKEEIQIDADKNMFATIIRNLLANAIKFTPDDGEVAVKLRKNKGSCEIIVQDTGVGIAEKDLEKIFRVDSTITTPGTCGEKGTGLGLVLCKEFVEMHGGTISVQSKSGIGSKFLVTLPLNNT